MGEALSLSEPGIQDSVDQFRAVRRELELSVLPLASSVDGRRFSFQASLHDLRLRHGGYVARSVEGRLGQVLSLEMVHSDGAAAIDLPTGRTAMTIRHARATAWWWRATALRSTTR